MNSSTEIGNMKKKILILGKRPTQGLEQTPCHRKNVFN